MPRTTELALGWACEPPCALWINRDHPITGVAPLVFAPYWAYLRRMLFQPESLSSYSQFGLLSDLFFGYSSLSSLERLRGCSPARFGGLGRVLGAGHLRMLFSKCTIANLYFVLSYVENDFRYC